MTNEPDYAFPHQYKSAPDQLTVCLGMTLRDYFAAKAMQSLLARTEFKGSAIDYASIAYEQADAMLKAREQ